MLLILIHYLNSIFNRKIPTVFTYSSTRMLLAAITALLLTILLGPYFVRKLYALKTGQSIRTSDCPPLARLHEKKRETPTMGGLLMLFALFVSMILWMDLTSPLTWILFVITAGFGLLGALDDFLKMKHKSHQGVSAKKKLLCQIGLVAFVSTYLFLPGCNAWLDKHTAVHAPTAKEHGVPKNEQGSALKLSEYMGRYYMPFLKSPIAIFSGAMLLLGWLFTIFVVTGASNAVNLTDGLDGLASGALVLCAGVLAVFAFLSNNLEISRYLNILYIEGSGEIAIYLCAVIGVSLGFLWYNGYPAQVFMGDTGSLALGGVIGMSAVLLRRELLLAIAGGVFVMEALSVILQVASYRLRDKKRIFLCAPLHHHFEYKGWHETKVVIRFWIMGLILALIALMSLKFQ